MAIGTLINDTWRLLTFRSTEEEMAAYTRGHLIFGLLCTWIAGMGRYWDDTEAGILQHLGTGSVVYVFLLAFILWLVVFPLKPKNWSYRGVLTFISLVSPPAILYAIPVEKFTENYTANVINVWFLLIVASWRVALLYFYLSRLASLDWLRVLVAALLPITAIVTTLSVLNLERAVFEVMGGLRTTSKDGAYLVLTVITFLSIFLLPLTLLGYGILAYLSHKRDRDEPYPKLNEIDPD